MMSLTSVSSQRVTTGRGSAATPPSSLFSRPALAGVLLVALLLYPSPCRANRDSNYYPSGFSNPNAENEKMYWRDPSNVLEDLSKFSKLYVTYQNCAWSPYSSGDDDDDDQENNNVCGMKAQQDDGDDGGGLWYAGYTECFRANAAYSLYGILKGDNDVGCTRKTFINSFFTTAGVEAFTTAVATAGGVTFSSSGDYYVNNNNYAEYEEDENGQDDYPGGFTSQCINEENNNGGGQSYGLVCSNGNEFAQKQYPNKYCHEPSSGATVTDSLRTFNRELAEAMCIPIYDSSNANNGYQQNEGSGDDYEYQPLDILQYSQTCNVREYPRQCPDPHGTLRIYSSAMAKSSTRSLHPTGERLKNLISWLLLLMGVLLLLGAASLYLRRQSRKNRKAAASGGTDDNSTVVIGDPDGQVRSSSDEKNGKFKFWKKGNKDKASSTASVGSAKSQKSWGWKRSTTKADDTDTETARKKSFWRPFDDTDTETTRKKSFWRPFRKS